MAPIMTEAAFQVPVLFDYVATFTWAVSGAIVAIRRRRNSTGGFMRTLLWIVLALTALFAAMNWPAFNASQPLWIGFASITAPLGVLLLGALAVITLLLLVEQSAALAESRRYAREIDAQRKLAEKAEASRYSELRAYVAEIRALGATPVICSPVIRKRWEADGLKVQRAGADFAAWAAEVARQAGAAFIDLNEWGAQRYEALGRETVEKLFPADTPQETVHTNWLGAAVNDDGRVMFGTTLFRGMTAFRPAITNWRTTEPDVDLVADVVRELGPSVAARMERSAG